ncbi:DUF1385 domain-containing protein [Candidatus Woesearchaeota archaeon]|nr:DUF1385 domain-containing protein [Candidatus Woesearchaeota archaeon]
MKEKQTSSSNEFLAIGGQAVIEGVLMRNKDTLAIAVRTEKGKIVLKKEKIPTLTEKYSFFGWPFFRGIVGFFQMLIIGMKALTYSTNVALGEDEEVLGFWEISGMIALSLAFALGFFVLVPYVVTNLLGFDDVRMPLLFNLIDGIIKMGLFLLYVYAISFMQDIHRVFQYHGAEHKAVNCFEAGKKLTVANVRQFSPIHPRCGTSFIMLVMIVGILLLSLIGPLMTFFFPSLLSLPFFFQKGVLFVIRILFLLPIAGVSYEVLKAAGKYRSNKILQLVNSPGLLLQKITTQEPDDKQIEVAMKALKGVV